jgi:peptidoglycan hydrolase-like protein with peptidoglycan-binding domain
VTDFIFDDFARTTLGGARNVANGNPLTPTQIQQVIDYLKSSGSGPDSATSYAEYLSKEMRAHPPRLPEGMDYVGFSGVDSVGIRNIDNAAEYISDVDKKAGIIGGTAWGDFISDAHSTPEFSAIRSKFETFMTAQGMEPYGSNYRGALEDIMWNAGSPEYFENAIATQRPIVAFVENAPAGRGFSNFELPTALNHPDAVINGYPVSAFGPDPLASASRSAAEFQQLERSIAQAATANSGRAVSVEQVRSSLNLIEGYDAVNKTVFNQPVDAFKSLSFDEMATTRSAWAASPVRVAPGLHAGTMADTPRGALAEPGAPRGPPSQALHAEGTAAAESIVPPGQRGLASMESLIGEVPRNTLISSGGLLATGVDLGVTAQRAAELLEQDNARGAQSEVDHALARNLGGWVGGTSMAAMVGTSGYFPVALIVADAVLVSKGFDKAVELKENREIYHQTDAQGVAWEFDGYSWSKEALIDKTPDGVDNPVAGRIDASYEKSRELGAYANVVAVEQALGKVPPPQDPFDIPARASDQLGLNNPNWKRNPDTEQWQRVVKTGVTGANDRGIYEVQTAEPDRAAELNREALGRIAENLANGRETVATTYLEHHAARRSGDFVEVPAAVQVALPRPDSVTGSDQRTYRRGADGAWTSLGHTAQGNLALELELTRMVRQPSIEQHAQRLASLEAQPAPMHEQMQQNEFLHRYHQRGIHLTPEWQQAIGLAMQRTRDEHGGLVGAGSLQLQPKPLEERTGGSAYSADSAIVHYQRGADGVDRIAAITRSEDIVQAWREVRARNQQPAVDSGMPESPDQRIAASSPQQREAQEQATREAQRSGLSQNEVERVATLAAVQVRAPGLGPAQAGRSETEVRPERENTAAPAAQGLHLGDRGDDVAMLQFRLQRVGMQGPEGQPVPQDGRYGPETEHAVRQFQQAQDLPVTGVADQNVQVALVRAHQAHLSPEVSQQSAAAAPSMPGQTAPTPDATRQDAAKPEEQVQAFREESRLRAAPAIASAASPPSGVGHGTGTQERGEDADALARSRTPAPSFPTDHRDYALFAAVRAYFPKETQDEKAAELMCAAKRGGIERADQLKRVRLMDDDRAIAFGKTPGFYGEVSLSTPAPSLEQSLQQSQAIDEKRAQQMEQFREQQARINAQSQGEGGPTLVR